MLSLGDDHNKQKIWKMTKDYNKPHRQLIQDNMLKKDETKKPKHCYNCFIHFKKSPSKLLFIH